MRIITLALALMLSVFSALAAEVTGTWALTIDTPNGPLDATLTLKQDGEKLTGTVVSQLGESPITGTAKDSDLSFSMTMDGVGTIAYTAKVTPEGKMDGSLDLAGQGSMKFTGTKK